MSIATQTRKPPQVAHRFANLNPSSYDSKARTFEAMIATATPVKRYFGMEVLRPETADLGRLSTCGIPLIDSHNVFSVGSIFGKMVRGWSNGGLMGLFALDDSVSGKMAEGLVSRGIGVSIGYRVDDDDWEVTDDEGDVVDPSRLRWDGEYTYTARRFELLEVSLTGVPADKNAFVRSFGSSAPIGAAAASVIIERMIARQLAAVGHEAHEVQASSISLRDQAVVREYAEPLRRRRRYPGQIWRSGRS